MSFRIFLSASLRANRIYLRQRISNTPRHRLFAALSRMRENDRFVPTSQRAFRIAFRIYRITRDVKTDATTSTTDLYITFYPSASRTRLFSRENNLDPQRMFARRTYCLIAFSFSSYEGASQALYLHPRSLENLLRAFAMTKLFSLSRTVSTRSPRVFTGFPPDQTNPPAVLSTRGPPKERISD